jgi:hypothetical protein
MDPSSFLQGMTRETSIRRDAEGNWFFDDEPLDHPNLTKAFNHWIERAEDGRYCLKNDINWAYFTLEGAPYFVERVRRDDAGAPLLELSNGSTEPLAAETLRSGDMVAKFSRHAASQLEPWLSEDDKGVYLELQGKRVRPEASSDPLTKVK